MKKHLDLFLTFFKLGITTFGGGYAMMANIKEIIIDKKQWLDEEELLEICAIAESTPGPIAINLATFIGYKRGKIIGSIFSTLGVVLPSLIIIYLISLILEKIIGNTYVSYAFVGINAAVAFLITKAGIDLFIKMKKSTWRLLVFFIVSILMILFELLSIRFSSIFFIIGGAIAGLFILSILVKRKELS